MDNMNKTNSMNIMNSYLISCITYNKKEKPVKIVYCTEEKVKDMIKKYNLKQSYKEYKYKLLKFKRIIPH